MMRTKKASGTKTKTGDTFKKPKLWQSIIATIGVVLIISLLLFIYPQKVAVGKAFYTQESGSAGIVDPGSALTAGQPFSLTVRANIGNAQTISIAFALRLPMERSCNDITAINSRLNWQQGDDSALVSSIAECVNNVVTFEFATLDTDEALTGEITIAQISFVGLPAGTYPLPFDLFEIVDLDEREAIDSILNTEITILQQATDTQQQAPDSSGTSGGSSSGSGSGSGTRSRSSGAGRQACTPQWTCLSWSSCEDGQQQRECIDERNCGTLLLRPALERNCTSVTALEQTSESDETNADLAKIQQPAVIPNVPDKVPISLWQMYKNYIISLVGLLIVVAIITLLVLQHHKRKLTTFHTSRNDKKK